MRRKLFFWIKKLIDIISAIIPSRSASALILCYHSINGANWDYNVDFSDFQKQIEFLLTTHHPISLSKIKNFNQKSFVVSFDDGYKNILKTRQFLKQKNIKPVLFLLSNNNKINHREIDNSFNFLTDKEVWTLLNDGWEIGSHGAAHLDYWQLPNSEIENEIFRSKQKLETRFGVKVKYFSYPKGRYTPNIISAVKKAGYKMAVTMDDKIITANTDNYLLPRIGVDRTHKFAEFKKILLVSTIKTRGFFKKLGGHTLAKLI